MAVDPGTTEPPAAPTADAIPRERLVRWLALLGLVPGAYGTLKSIAIVGVFESSIKSAGQAWVMTQGHHLEASLDVLLPVLLLTGCVACLRRKTWGRTLLLFYAWLCLATSALAVVDRIGDLASGRYGPIWRQLLVLLVGPFDESVYGSVFAVALICIMTPKSARNLFERKGSGFEPLFPANPR